MYHSCSKGQNWLGPRGQWFYTDLNDKDEPSYLTFDLIFILPLLADLLPCFCSYSIEFELYLSFYMKTSTLALATLTFWPFCFLSYVYVIWNICTVLPVDFNFKTLTSGEQYRIIMVFLFGSALVLGFTNARIWCSKIYMNNFMIISKVNDLFCLYSMHYLLILKKSIV